MVETKRPEDVSQYNERSLNALDRAIALSQGEFSLVLVRCNYKLLQKRIFKQLKERSQHRYQIRELVLPASVTTLYTTIQGYVKAEESCKNVLAPRQEVLHHATPDETTANLALTSAPRLREPNPALMITGLESVEALDDLLTSTNQVRDEFRKRLPFPLVLWVNDEVLQKLVRFAPDFSSWAATPIKFEIATDELIDFLRQKAESLFRTVLHGGTGRYAPWRVCTHHATLNLATGCRSRLELDCALRDLQSRQHIIHPELEASLQFVLGQYDYASDAIDAALVRYQKSLRFWRVTNNLLREGILLFHIGLCYCRNADLHRAQRRRNWEEAWPYLQQCVEIFDRAGRQDLVAQFITQLAEVLQHLEGWDLLQKLAKKSLILHQLYGSQVQLAQDYGFLAEVALADSRWVDANRFAQKALSLLNSTSEKFSPDQGLHRFLLAQLYQLFLVQSYRQLGQLSAAQQHLKTASQELQAAVESSDYHYEPQRYLHLLENLRRLYFEQRQYLEAFRIKQEQRTVEQLYGFRAFIGAARLQPRRSVSNPTLTPLEQQEMVAQEIAASGRQQDVNRLIERLSRADCKLTIIHGPSGVGKSSIVSAGLVPALQHRALGDRITLPIVVQVYTDWVRELTKSLANAGLEIETWENSELSPAALISPILEQLKENGDGNFLTVLIFDQFEEFFLGYTTLSQRRLFYAFLRDCLNLSFVKVIISIREDYLHYLLELEHFDLDCIDNNILDRKIRYPLGNFSLPDARAVIQSLTERAYFYLEPMLIDELVQDLAGERGEVRPIELQVVGAQLQAENITTLAQYRQRGPVEKLAERFLEKVIKDCGRENEQAAWLVLHLLTDENQNRPLKTRSELIIESAIDTQQLDLILEILEKSGLVFLLPEIPTNRYQLVHDYLIEFIRQKEQANIKTELEELRKKDRQSQDRIKRLIREKKLRSKLAEATEKQRQTEEKLNQVLRRSLREARLVGVTLATLTVIAGVLGLRAAFSETNARFIALNASSEALVASNRPFDALLKSLWAGREIKRSLGVPSETQTRVITALQQAVYGVRERNRLKGHSDGVNSISFSPNGEYLASGSADKTIKLWRKDGKLLETLPGHTAEVYSVSFSPDGEILASASADKTIKLWSQEGKLIRTLTEPSASGIHSISFSPDSQIVASAGEDNLIRLWRKNGTLLKTLNSHSDWVLGVSFSPDGELLASASGDKTVKLWRRDGTLLQTLQGHTQPVLDVSFSPDGKTLASASADHTIKLWRSDGTFIKTLSGHTGTVMSVRFSADGRLMASGSADNTIKLWQADGTLIETLQGHGKRVEAVSFSPDSKTLASGSADNTIKLWQTDGGMLQPIQGYAAPVSSVSFSPDGEIIATASWDKTIKLWTRNGVLLKSIPAHEGQVSHVSFAPNGRTIATASWDKTVKLWSLEGTLDNTLRGHQDRVTSVSFSPDGKWIASSSADKTVKLWKADGTLDKTLTHGAEVWGVTFSPDGRLIASASEDKTVKLWNRDGKLITTLKGHNGSVNWVSFSPDGRLIASGSSDGTVNLWTRDGEFVNSLKGHNGSVNWVSFSPDGELIASASDDRTINLWSRQEGHLINSFTGHTDAVFGVSFSPDGNVLASASRDETLILWNLDLDDLLRRGCSWLGDYLQNSLEPQSVSDASPRDFRAFCKSVLGR
ncbi:MULTISPECIES: hypothetical protein [unclassified Coleofasciculus]|uniref:WD40 domain-containing protein n=1 Tax=unclassified Coleofasciculus TaxID=2692782 RepID=UPI001880D6DA|nr:MULTISPECIES: hypothetical protein [unclassified Coleofasciculus]MBE9127148.1 hypothetical protein [Coleofasciculus sp. LEGE 07081]MBE9150285.1 hypothetical protein [Coleofasciculus sp. LEGE 07092]